MNLTGFLAENLSAISRLNIREDDVVYCVKLSSITNRRVQSPTAGKLSGFMSGITNAVADTVSSAIHNSYLLATKSGTVYLLSDKINDVLFTPSNARIETATESGVIKSTVYFPGGSAENASLKVSADNFEETFGGDVAQFIRDFDSACQIPTEGMSSKYLLVKMSERVISPEKLSAFKNMSAVNSLVSQDSDSIYIYNNKTKINKNDVLAYYKKDGCCQLLAKEGDYIRLIELIEDKEANASSLEHNLIANYESAYEGGIDISFPEKALRAESYISAYGTQQFTLVTVDNTMYAIKENALMPCGAFTVGEDIYIKTQDGETKRYENSAYVTEIFSTLPSSADVIFTEAGKAQPFIANSQVENFTVTENAIISEAHTYEFTKMQNYTYVAKAYTCTVKFGYDGVEVELTTANSLGINISNLQEKVATKAAIEEYNVNQLYDCLYSRSSKKVLAGTLGEIFKTDAMLNSDGTVDELIMAIRMTDGDVLRGAGKSLLGKFKNVDDIQSELIEKVSLIEMQRKKIQKMADEWLLYYPHHMATAQVEWLKGIFGAKAGAEFLKTEYWKCVAAYKRTLGGVSAYINKSMAEMAMCANNLRASLPDEVKRADITGALRVNSLKKTDMLKAGADVTLAVSAGIELATIIARGMSASNPLSIAMSAKMIVNSYVNDVNQRKDIKAYGLQMLEWWQIMMKGLQIHILEMSNSITDYNKLCLKRDTDIFKTLADADKAQVKNKLTAALKSKIVDDVDEKYLEVLPQCNLRILNIIESIDTNLGFREETLAEFKEHLYI